MWGSSEMPEGCAGHAGRRLRGARCWMHVCSSHYWAWEVRDLRWAGPCRMNLAWFVARGRRGGVGISETAKVGGAPEAYCRKVERECWQSVEAIDCVISMCIVGDGRVVAPLLPPLLLRLLLCRSCQTPLGPAGLHARLRQTLRLSL
jgi:hypothetical protein